MISNCSSVCSNFYPRSPCGERLSRIFINNSRTLISIHALLAESDHLVIDKDFETIHISIHALLAESDIRQAFLSLTPKTFLSTLSLRRATEKEHTQEQSLSNFYPRSPCGERLSRLFRQALCPLFLSTLSLRRATRYGCFRC